MADSQNENVTWLTQEAYDRLKAEYEYLSGPGRTDIAKKIEAAREEGDLKENGGYHAAKDEQGKMEARIFHLRQILDSARVGEAPRDRRRRGSRHDGDGPVRRRRRGGDVPAGLPRGERRADRRLLAEVARSARRSTARRSVRRRRTRMPNGRQNTVEILEAVPYIGN